MASLYSSPPLSSFSEGMVRFVCELCGRRGQYRKQTLIERYGPDIVGPDLLVKVANCPRHRALDGRCGIVYEDLLPKRPAPISGRPQLRLVSTDAPKEI
jgi:hypothetical protein